MDSPLVISAAIFLAAVGLAFGVSIACPVFPIIEISCLLFVFFLGLGSAASCLFHLLFLLIEGQSAQGGSAWFGPLIVLGALWKPLNYIAGKLDAVLTKNRGKK